MKLFHLLFLPLALGFTAATAFAEYQVPALTPPWPGVSEILLWPNGAPGSEGITARENYSPPSARSPHGHLSPVHYPSVYVFPAPKDKATGVGVLVYPGGGYNTLTIDSEGRDVALWLNQIGITAFVVKYRLSQTPRFPNYTLDTSIGDALRALRLVRSRAADWGLDPHRLGVMGFSAGGSVVAGACVRFDAGQPDAADPIERASSRPDFSVIVYPGDVFFPATIPKDAAPVLVVGSSEDSVHAINSLKIYRAYLDANIPAELHIYQSGAHGFGVAPTDLPVGSWTDRCKDWLVELKVLAKK
jgi:endo-1,4-beta-xylanase